MVMDYGEEGDLFSMITDVRRYVGYDDLIRSVFLQLVDGVAWLHHLGIAHRDIKPENIVCSDNGTRVRICDFGLATSSTTSNEFGCGSTFYIAPECLGDWFPERPTYATQTGDIWSLGVILVNLVCGRNPWRIASPNDESFNAFLKDPQFLRRILPISEECLYILCRIFAVEPANRISLEELGQLVLSCRSFSMSEDEVIAAHSAAQTQVHHPASEPQTPPPSVHSESHVDSVTKPFDLLPPDLSSPTMEDGQWMEDDEGLFTYDDDEEMESKSDSASDETPSLRADSESPSPLNARSRSASADGGSLPPTPLLGSSSEVVTTPLPPYEKVWEQLLKNAPLAPRRPSTSGLVNIRTSSPDCVSANHAFFN